MKEHPILFSTEMVKAILAGNKTQTRRIVKAEIPVNITKIIESDIDKQFHELWKGGVSEYLIKCPYGQPGDLLWVRETWAQVKGSDKIHFKADFKNPQNYKGWKPSIHLKKEAARIWLQIEEINVERLRDIKSHDAMCEGMIENGEPFVPRFYDLWIKINGQQSFDLNPWVWVIKFKVISKTGKP